MVVNKLLNLGFSENEAKSYISLLEYSPVTAYEIAKRSNIPTSKIYEVISKLIEKEIILEIKENQKTKYVPKDPDKFIEGVRAISPTFGGINLEDIKAPECFEIEEKLKDGDLKTFHLKKDR